MTDCFDTFDLTSRHRNNRLERPIALSAMIRKSGNEIDTVGTAVKSCPWSQNLKMVRLSVDEKRILRLEDVVFLNECDVNFPGEPSPRFVGVRHGNMQVTYMVRKSIKQAFTVSIFMAFQSTVEKLRRCK